MTHILGRWASEFTLELISESNNLIGNSLPWALADDNSIWCSVHREERARCEHFSHVCAKSACLPFLSIPPNLPSPSLSSPLSHSFLPVSSYVPIFLIVDASCFRAAAAVAVVPRLPSIQPRVPLSFLNPLCSCNTIAPPS